MMTPDEIRAAKELAEHSDPGPWGLEDEVNEHVMVTRGRNKRGAFLYIANVGWAEKPSTIIFIAASRTLVPALCDTALSAIERADTLFDAIKHGDDEHQAWLKEAIAAHFSGQPAPPLKDKSG